MHSIPRRTFIARLGAGALAAAGCAAPQNRGSDVTPLYIGTYTRGRSRGIYRARMDAGTGAITVDGVTEGIRNPSYLALSPNHAHLYAVSEVGDFAPLSGGLVAYEIDRGGGLRELNRQPSRGADPCYVSVDATGRWLFVANYTGGNAAVLPIASDGSLGEPVEVVQHEGSSADPRRQRGPHAHWVAADPANRFVFVVDLGIDRVAGYRFDASTGALRPAENAGVAARPGAGPRHLDFHPDGRRACVINELDSSLTALSYDPATGSMESLGSVSTLPEGFTGDNSCADVHVHPGGEYVYGSNRGHDSIAVFRMDRATGRLTLVQHQSTLGRVPRNFAIHPGGRFLVAANQESDSLVVFAIDSATGRLSPVGDPIDVPVPVCVRFA